MDRNKFLIVSFILISYYGNYMVDAVNSCIQCFNCAEVFVPGTPGTVCMKGTDTCMKTMIKYPGGALITKTCTPASACTSTSLNLLGFGFWMSCCNNNDDCNSSVNLFKQNSIAFSLTLSLLTAYYIIARYFI